MNIHVPSSSTLLLLSAIGLFLVVCYHVRVISFASNIYTLDNDGFDHGSPNKKRQAIVYLVQAESCLSEHFSSFIKLDSHATRDVLVLSWGRQCLAISSHLDLTSLVNKGFIIWLLGNFFSCGTWWVVLSGQDSSILPAQVANHSTRFGSSCPLTELTV